jgi:hypothetical protein
MAGNAGEALQTSGGSTYVIDGSSTYAYAEATCS